MVNIDSGTYVYAQMTPAQAHTFRCLLQAQCISILWEDDDTVTAGWLRMLIDLNESRTRDIVNQALQAPFAEVEDTDA